MRRLALHASALSDAEYELYTAILRDIALADDDTQTGSSGATDDTYFENLNIGVREARAWLRGRYSHLSASTIDQILKLFSPNLGHDDTISGSEFFAAVRLVIHAEAGKDVERSLAFVQADLGQRRPGKESGRAISPPNRHRGIPAAPPTPSRPANTDSISHSGLDSSFHNPFSLSDHPQPPLHPSHRSESSKSIASTSQHSAHNPFVHRPPPPRSEDGAGKIPPLPPRKPPPPIPSQPLVPPPRHITTRNRAERSMSPSKPPNVLPVPAQKLPHHVTSTLMKQSLQASKVAHTMKKAEEQLEKERVMQVLKSSSVVSGTNIHNQHHHPWSISPGKYALSSASSASDERAPPLPRRRNQPQQPSPPVSTSSLEQVALAAPPNFPAPSTGYGLANSIPNTSPFRSPVELTPPNNDCPEHCPPPTHPDRKPYIPYQATSSSTPSRNPNLETFEAIYGPATASTTLSSSFGIPATPESPNSTHSSNSSTSRSFRSKSMHQTSPPLPPLPPPVRRKRPESVQVLGSGEVLQGSLTRLDAASSASSSSSTLSKHTSFSTPSHRRSSLSVSSTPHSTNATHASAHTDSPLSNIQRTIATLQPKLDALQIQPRLDKARYKAEAGLSRRGFVSGGRAKSGLEGQEQEGLVRRGSGRRTQHQWTPSSRNEDPEGKGNIFDDPDIDSDGLGDDVEGNGSWMKSRGMDSSAVGESMRGRNFFHAEESPLGSGGDDALGPVEKDNLKWPAGEGWKPL